MDNQKVLFYFLIVFLVLLFITTFSNIYNSKVNEINEGFTSSSSTTTTGPTQSSTSTTTGPTQSSTSTTTGPTQSSTSTTTGPTQSSTSTTTGPTQSSTSTTTGPTQSSSSTTGGTTAAGTTAAGTTAAGTTAAGTTAAGTTAAGTTAAGTTAAETTAAQTTAAGTTAAGTTAAQTSAATTATRTVSSQLSEYVREYIDARLESETEAINRIRDTNNRLENISDRLDMVDESYERAHAISKNYQDFHSDYQEKLEKLLNQKFDTDVNKFDVNNRIHAMRLQKIKEDLEYLDTVREDLENEGVDPSSPNANNRGQSLRAMSDGSRLNFEYVVVNGERTNKIVISVNDGCLSYGDPAELENGKATMSLTLNCAEKYNQPHVHFEIHTINNYIEYNAKINYENDGTKRLVSDDDEISYPFKVVSPTRHFGQCIELNDGNLRIVPCINDISQRFKISNSQVLGECPVESS